MVHFNPLGQQLLYCYTKTYVYIYIYIYIYIYSLVQLTPSVTLSDITPLNNLLLDANFDKSTVGLHYIHILFILTKFHGGKK